MGFNKCRSIKVSERVFDLVCTELDFEQTENYVKIDGYLMTFHNGREQGYVLSVSSTDFDNENKTNDMFFVWVHEHRSGDSIVVRWQTKYPNDGMYEEETYNDRTRCFKYNEEHKAADFITNLVREHFAEEFSN